MYDQYDGIIRTAASEHQVPFVWIKAVIGTESSFQEDAYRAEPQINDGSHGLMQILMRTARGLGYQGSVEGLYDPAVNINLGAKLLRELIDRFGGDFRRVYSAYNSGDPTKYTWDSQVAKNTARAEEWLRRFSGAGTGTAPLFLALGFAVLMSDMGRGK